MHAWPHNSDTRYGALLYPPLIKIARNTKNTKFETYSALTTNNKWQTAYLLMHVVPELSRLLSHCAARAHCQLWIPAMAPMKSMKAMKASAKAMTKTGIAEALASESGLKKSECAKIVDSLAAIATKEVKNSGKFVLPGLCMLKTRNKPATKAGKREMFGKTVVVKAKPAKTIVKAFPVAALKKSI